jgi:hypothetical protein
MKAKVKIANNKMEMKWIIVVYNIQARPKEQNASTGEYKKMHYSGVSFPEESPVEKAVNKSDNYKIPNSLA